jgi:CheY-like chemotaxis protein
MTKAIPVPDAPREPLTVLVAEDEALVRLMLAGELREHGLQVIEAVDGEEALSVLSSMRIDVVIVDLHMRKFRDGLAVAQYVRRHRRTVPVILASLETPSVHEQSLFDVFFVKPYSPEAIAAWIKRHHASASPLKARERA